MLARSLALAAASLVLIAGLASAGDGAADDPAAPACPLRTVAAGVVIDIVERAAPEAGADEACRRVNPTAGELCDPANNVGDEVAKACLAVADVDGDGMLDVVALVLAPESAASEALRRGSENCDQGGNTLAGLAIDEPGVHRACAAVADLDGDGMPDMVALVRDLRDGAIDGACAQIDGSDAGASGPGACGSVWDSRSQVWEALRTATEASAACAAAHKVAPLSGGLERACVAIGDLDGDGMLDVVVPQAGAACGNADEQLRHHDIQGLDNPELCKTWDEGASQLRAFHEMAKAVIGNIRA